MRGKSGGAVSADAGVGEQFMELKGPLELAFDEELMPAAVTGVIDQREKLLVARRARLKIADGGFHGETETGADVKGLVGAQGSAYRSHRRYPPSLKSLLLLPILIRA